MAQVSKYWDRGAGNNNWDALANWSLESNAATPNPNVKPNANDIAVFNANLNPPLGAPTINLGGAQAVHGLIFRHNNPVTLENGLLSVGAGGITTNGGAANNFISATVALNSSQFWINNSSNTLTSSGGVVTNGWGLTLTGGGHTTISGGISGLGGVAKTGAGVARLTGPNTYSGGTPISQGTLIFSPGAVPAQGSISVSSGAKVGLETIGQGNFNFGTFGNLISLSHASTLEFRSDLGGGQGFSQSVWFGNVALAGDTTVATNAGPYTVGRIDGTISGAGNLFVNGFVQLNNHNTFTGQTRILGGEVLLSHTNALTGSTLHLHQNDSGTVRFEGMTSATVGSLVGTRTLLLQNSSGQPVALTFGSNNSDNSYNGALTGSGSIVKAGNGIHTLRGASNYSGGTTINAGALNVAAEANLGNSVGRLTFGGGTLQTAAHFTSTRPVTLSGPGGAIDTQSFNPIFTGDFTGNGALHKFGTGTLRLSGSNNYSGGTNVNAGTLTFASTAAVSAMPVAGNVNVATGATLNLESSNPPTSGGGIFGFGTFGPTVFLNHASTLRFSNQPGTAAAVNALFHNVSLSGDVTIANSQPILVGQVSGAIGGGGNLFVDGIIRTANSNSFTGQTRILNGQLRVAHSQSLQDSTLYLHPSDAGSVTFDAALTMATLGALRGSRNLLLQNDVLQPMALTVGKNNATFDYSGVLSGSGSLTKIGSGTQTLSGPNSYTGTTTVNSGTLAFNTPGSFPANSDTVTVNPGAKLTFLSVGGYGSAGQLLRLNGATLEMLDAGAGPQSIWNGNVELTGNSTIRHIGTVPEIGIFPGTISGPGGLIINGGRIQLSNANTFAGNTRITTGQLFLNHSSALQNSTLLLDGGDIGSFSFGTLTTATLGGLRDLSGTRHIVLNNENSSSVALSVGNNDSSTTYVGRFSGSGSLTKIGAGTFTLSGTANNYTGGTFVNQGSLRVDGVISGPVIISPGGTLTGTGIVGGGVNVASGGSLRGTLDIQGSVVSAGRVAPGFSPEIIHIDGNYTQTGGGTLEIEVQGHTPGSEHDQLQVGGTASLAGRLEIPILQPFNPITGPIVGQPIQFLTAGARTGEFSAVVSPNLEALYPNLAVEVAYQPTGAQLTFVPKKVNIEFEDVLNDGSPEWYEVLSWNNIDDPDNDTVPTAAHDLTIENNAGAPQALAITSSNAFVAGLTIGGGSEELILSVGDGSLFNNADNLSSLTNVNIGHNGVVALNRGTLATSNVRIDSGGMLTGDGLVDLAGASVSAPGEFVVANGVVSPGISVGHLEVDGDYRQFENGVMKIDINGKFIGQHDTISVSGSAELGGTIVIDATNMTFQGPGTTIPILTADGGLGGTEFDEIQTIGANGFYFVPLYSPDAFQVMQAPDGDMNPHVPGLDPTDIEAFALALMNSGVGMDRKDPRYPYTYVGTYGLSPQVACTCNGDGWFDFSDINRFVQIMESAGILNSQARLERALAAVPEPSSLSLASIGLLGALQTGRLRRRFPSRRWLPHRHQ